MQNQISLPTQIKMNQTPPQKKQPQTLKTVNKKKIIKIIWWSKQGISDLDLKTHKIIQEAQLLVNTMCAVCRKFLMKESDALCEKHRTHDKSVCVTFVV